MAFQSLQRRFVRPGQPGNVDILIRSADRDSASADPSRCRVAVIGAERFAALDSVVRNASVFRAFGNIVANVNDRFLVQEDTGLLTVTLTPGYYSGPQLAGLMQTALTAASAKTYTVVWDPLTLKFTWTVNVGTIQFLWATWRSHTHRVCAQQYGWQMGVNTAAAITLTSGQIAAVDPFDAVYMRVGEYDDGIASYAPSTNTLYVPINDTGAGEWIHYRATTEYLYIIKQLGALARQFELFISCPDAPANQYYASGCDWEMSVFAHTFENDSSRVSEQEAQAIEERQTKRRRTERRPMQQLG
jgi:hypothetical protein